MFSGKNIKWIILSMISFVASLGSWTLSQGAETVDEEKAYGLKMYLELLAQFTQFTWGMILALFLYSAAIASKP